MKFDFLVKKQSYEQMNSDPLQKLTPKNFSSSPDSNESVYSSSTPLPFENSGQQALVAYKEDSDDDEYTDEYFRELESIQKFNDEDVIEIDSFDTNEVYNQRISEYVELVAKRHSEMGTTSLISMLTQIGGEQEGPEVRSEESPRRSNIPAVLSCHGCDRELSPVCLDEVLMPVLATVRLKSGKGAASKS